MNGRFLGDDPREVPRIRIIQAVNANQERPYSRSTAAGFSLID